MDFYLRKKSITAISIIYFFLLFSLGVTCVKNQTPNYSKINSEMDKDTLLVEMQKILDDEFKLFYPLSIDTLYGGFFSDINYKWELEGVQNKMIVTQARHIWSTANAALFYNNDEFIKISAHGFKFLKNKMWDQKYGGFYDLVNRQGEPLDEHGEIIKRAYGNAFAIYGLAEYYKASGDPGALKLAQETFNWLEKNSYDPVFGGYFQFLSRDGKPFKEGYRDVPPKDQNSSIHLLEAFTELYTVWPDEKLKERLTSLQRIIRDTITTEKGYMNLFFKGDWTPVLNGEYEIDHVSFGHDVETAYLLLETSNALKVENDSSTLKVAKRMVDHALQNGWDEKYGGLYDGGYYYDTKQKQASIIKDSKEWWSQVEALNSFLMMSELFPDNKDYYKKFLIQWDYIKHYLIDNKYGGWYWGGIDKVPDNKSFPKVTIWKCNYHTSRGLINCIKMIKEKYKK